MNTTSNVSLRPGSIWINGRPQLLLSSSLFYFRLPAAEWRSRMRTLRALGYNAIDVYFPWNYHEAAPGRWDFNGERDAGAFLRIAQAEGLWVIARPGPYICSEWDGGGLPAHLLAQADVCLRDACPAYLDAVRSWYDRILPIVAACQLDRGGAVIMVQLENELDFYDCTDRAGMMAALRDMALAHGITVPLIACAGQGDIAGATGEVEGLVPTCNFYFGPRDPTVEVRVRHYEQILRQRGYPLCVTETNRSHTDLRRLIAGGARLVGPYLQTGGSDFGFTTSITNWGDPLALMTAYYDFGGMISPGGKVRAEGAEALLLAKMIAALGPALALATPQATAPVAVNGVVGHTLALAGGGYLVALPNLGEAVAQVTLGAPGAQFPVHAALAVAPNTCPFVLLDYPLGPWSSTGGRIAYATAELVEQRQEHGLQLTFAPASAAELLVELPGATAIAARGWQTAQTPTGWRLWTDGAGPAEVTITGADGKQLIVKALPRAEVGDLRQAGLDASLLAAASPDLPAGASAAVSWRTAAADPCEQAWFAGAKACPPGKLHLEENGIWRGFGWYQADHVAGKDVQGFLVHAGADVLSLYLDGRFLGAVVPGGGDAFVPLPQDDALAAAGSLVVRAEIWGHCNFDDHRLPALRLNARRGMGGLMAVRSKENISGAWFYQHNALEPVAPVDPVNPAWPYIAFGGWSATDEPLRGVYYRSLACAAGVDACVLHCAGLQATARVFVDGQPAGLVNPFNPYIDLSNWLRPGKSLTLAVAVEHDYRRPAGQVWLYQGEWLRQWRLAPWDEAGLVRRAQENSALASAVSLPLQLPAGAMAWLHGELPRSAGWEQGLTIQLAGQGIKAAVLIGQRLVGRIWLPGALRPRMAGGAADRLVLPASWLEEAGGELHLLLESVSLEAELQSIQFMPDR